MLDASGQVSKRTSHLQGNEGDDLLIGGAGEYTLYGAYGADRIVSNSDATRIEYVETVDSTRKQFDTIERFQGSLWLLFDSDTSTSARDHDFHLGRTAERVGDILMKYDAGRDETIVKVFTDGDKVADFVLHLTGDVPLTAADFIFG